jgi:hypothetical protein
MNLHEKLSHQLQELYPQVNNNDVLLQENSSRGNIIPLRTPAISYTNVVPDFAITLPQAKEKIELLQTFIKEMMVEGVDFGYIPGFSKPSLFKPGAEKLCDVFGFSKYIETTHRLEDWNKGTFAYEVKVTLINKRTGLMEAEGLGSCNSLEERYIQQDGFTIANTILKMAKKRALIDAVLTAVCVSGSFTQDAEGINCFISAPMQNKSKPESEYSQPVKPATERQHNKIYALVREIGLSDSAVKQLLADRYQAKISTELSLKQASDFISHLIQLKC